MDALNQICQVLQTQRSKLERDLAGLAREIFEADTKLAAMEREQLDMMGKALGGTLSDDLVTDAINFDRWKVGALKAAETLREWREARVRERETIRQALTAVIVKEDFIAEQLKVRKHTARQTREEKASSSRLETWVNNNLL